MSFARAPNAAGFLIKATEGRLLPWTLANELHNRQEALWRIDMGADLDELRYYLDEYGSTYAGACQGMSYASEL